MKAATGDAFPLRRFISTFQSTPPVKAATVKGKILDGQTDISIHAAREGGDNQTALCPVECLISIHAAREGGDPYGI